MVLQRLMSNPIIRIGLIRESKQPADRRVPLTPLQAQALVQTYPNLQILVEKSPDRAYKDEEYAELGVPLVDHEAMKQCDLLMGVKEVKTDQLIAGKDYMFFSHTIKKQPYNKALFDKVRELNIRLLDYETMVDERGLRLIGFGRFAGLVGAYNGLMTWGLRTGQYALPRAMQIDDLKAVMREAAEISYPPIKILVTGKGRVGKGAVEMLEAAGIRYVDVPHFLHTEPEDDPFYTVIDVEHYNAHKDGKAFDQAHFFAHPEDYVSAFEPFTKTTDLLIAAAYWDPKSPVLFTKEDTQKPDFRIKAIADITCDIEGSVPTTLRACTPEDPFYDYSPKKGKEKKAFSSLDHINVMAIDTLPGELPRDASEAFGDVLMRGILPHYLKDPQHEVINRAAITDQKGQVMPRFAYLNDWK